MTESFLELKQLQLKYLKYYYVIEKLSQQYRVSRNSFTSKESFKFFTIISAKIETNTRIYGTICANHKNGNNGKEVEATRPCHDVRSKKPE